MTPRPLPRFPEPDSEAFWQATRRGWSPTGAAEAVTPRSSSCGPTAPGAVRSTSTTRCRAEWAPSTGCTVVRRDGQPGFKDRTPHVAALVDLDEGIRVLTEIVTDDVDTVRIGQRVELVWEEHEEAAVALFRPVDAAP